MKVEWYKNASYLSQVHCSGLEYAYLSKDNKQICPFVYCKDFLQDALHGQLNKKSISIWGFNYNPTTDTPIDTKKFRLLITNASDAEFKTKIPNVLDFIHQIETKLGLKKTISVVTEVENPPKKYEKSGVFLFEGSQRWLRSPPMISLYTLLIRVGFSHVSGKTFEETIKGILNKKIKPYCYADQKYLKDCKPAFDLILEKGDREIFSKKIKENYPSKITTNNMHDNCGIVAYAKGKTKKWYGTKWKFHPEEVVKNEA